MTRLGPLFLFAAMCASVAPVAAAPQRGIRENRGGGGHAERKPASPPVPTTPSSINRPSFFLNGVNRPAFQPTGAPPASPFAAGQTFDPRFNRLSRGPRTFGIPLGYGFGTPGFYGDAYGAYGDNPYADNNAAVSAERAGLNEGEGVLYLDATPRGAQVFVDSAYVGTVDDLYSSGVTLTGGRHWLEIEAPEYEKKLVEIIVTPGLPLRYRADLSPVRRAAVTVIAARPPEAMYAIPGCYGGNKPPVASALPPGCDIKDLRVIKPQAQRAN